MGASVSNLTCDGVPGVATMNIRQMNLPHPSVANTSAFHPNVNTGVNSNIGGNVTGNVGFSKPLNVFNHTSDNNGPAADTGNAGRAQDSMNRNFGSFGGRQLNVSADRATPDATPQVSVDTGNTQRSFSNGSGGNRRNFGGDQPITTYGAQGAQAGAASHTDTSRLFGGSRRMNVETGAQQTPGFSGSHAGGFDASRKIDVDHTSRFGGFAAGNQAGTSNTQKIDANPAIATESNSGRGNWGGRAFRRQQDR